MNRTYTVFVSRKCFFAYDKVQPNGCKSYERHGTVMSELNRTGCRNTSGGTQTSSVGNYASGVGNVLIDTYQVFDSCRDRDCFEDTRVFLDELGQSLIEHTNQVRTKSAEICSAAISVDPVQLSRGFYRVTVRCYVRLECEACVCPGRSQTFSGLAVTEKESVLYGGEGEVRVFRSNAVSDSFCSSPCQGEMTTNLPVAVVETVDPVILGTRVVDPASNTCSQCCCCEDIPESVRTAVGTNPIENGQRQLAVSLGFFSVIRLERPEQYLVNAVEFSVPDKECSHNDDDTPCDAFSRMAFPTEEFSPGRIRSDIGFGCNCMNSAGTSSTSSQADNNCGRGR